MMEGGNVNPSTGRLREHFIEQIMLDLAFELR